MNATEVLLPQFVFPRGRVAMATALRILNLDPKSRVGLQAYTCRAVPDAVVAAGHHPVFVDTAERSIFPGAAQVRSAGHLDAFIVQHTFGATFPRTSLEALPSSVPIIEDAAHRTDAPYFEEGRAFASVFSYEWGKPLPLGRGGGLVLNEEYRRLLADVYAASYELAPSDPVHDAMAAAFRYSYRPETYWALKASFNLIGRFSSKGNFDINDTEFRRRLEPGTVARIETVGRKRAEREPHLGAIRSIYDAVVGASVDHEDEAELLRYPIWVADKARVLSAARRRFIELADWFATSVDPLTDDLVPQIYNSQIAHTRNAREASQHIVSLPITPRLSLGEAARIARFARSWKE
ncbi:DegT/DnrJ/EryC1/StrS family aminotransferase [Euzebya rosea]|uniref:DegT/DnrJ/EryC1/StrS family aminotransferase n=1 Tax=Euzebya rosea TaxID=2052804 RepID=UPI000D3E51B5|nr:DegT/DnrJ/EryC1/StrS family aminotransferase [Euzebya rosea]